MEPSESPAAAAIGVRKLDETVRLVRIAGWLTITASVLAVPAALALDPQPPAEDFLVPLISAVFALGLLVGPRRWLTAWCIYAAIVGGTIATAASVEVFGGDFAFCNALVAVYAAYAVRTRAEFAACLALTTVALFAPVALGSGGSEPADTASGEHDEGEHPQLITLPVMLISAVAVRELRETLERRQRIYQEFADEALELAMRIRGADRPHTARELEGELDELVARADEDREA